MESRSSKLRKRLRWSQQRLAEALGVNRSTISRMETSGIERGPVARMLDVIERESSRDIEVASETGPAS